jgi:hypothetical protein
MLYKGLSTISPVRTDFGHDRYDYLKGLATIQIDLGPESFYEEAESEESFLVFPNPLNRGSLYVTLPAKSIQLNIIDITGKSIFNLNVTLSSYVISNEVFRTNGVYIIKVIADQYSFHRKLIVDR